MTRVRFGLTLSNRDVALGTATAANLIALAEAAEDSGGFEHVWVGDTIMGKPRLEAITLLAAIAARTTKIKLGVACMATVPTRNPLVLAYQWASLDLLAEGRTIFDACMGDEQDVALMRAEYANMGIDPKNRAALMEENIRIIMRLWTEDQVDYDGHFHQYTAASVSPKPARRPPMWITATPKTEKPHLVVRSLRRVVELSDGWMTTAKSPVWYGELWGSLRALGHEMGRPFEEKPRAHYYAINIAANRQAALEESKKWMDQYYHRDNSPEYVSGSTALGSPEECAQDIMAYVDQGATDVLLRFHSYDPARQFRRFLDEVLPFFD